MGTSYDSILKSIKTYLEQNGAKGSDGELNKVREIEQHLQAINQMIADPEQKVDDSNQGLEAVRDACESVTYSSYLPTKAKVAALSELVKKMKIENFPEIIQPKGIEIKGYLDEISEQLQRVKGVVNELAKKLKGFEEKQYKISAAEERDMKMTTLQVEYDLKICEDIQKRAGDALKELDSDTNSYNARQKKSAWIKVACAIVAGVGVGAISAGVTAVALAFGVAGTVSGVGVGGAGGGAILGGASGGYYTYSFFRKYEEIQTETKKLNAALECLRSKRKRLHTENEAIKKKLEKCKVVSE